MSETQTTISTARLYHLERYQEIASAYIGIARLHLGNGDSKRAKEALDTCCDKLDALLSPGVRALMESQRT